MRKNLRWILGIGSMCAALYAAPATAVDSAVLSELNCSLKHQGDGLALLVCPAAAADESLVRAGKAVCPTKGARCNVWVWNNVKDVPSNAPLNDAAIPKPLAARAIAVWVNDSARLLKLRQIK